MDFIFQTGHNQKHLLYTMGEHIIMRRIQADFLSRPVYLAHDYADHLYGTFLDHNIYYSYITINEELTIKSISSEQPVFQLGADDLHRYVQAQIVSFNGHIILLYTVHNPSDNKWDVRYAVINSPASENISSEIYDLLCDLSCKPVFSVLNTGSHLIINIHSDDNNSLWRLSSDSEFISHDDISDTFKQQTMFRLDKISPIHEDAGKLQQASNLMMNKISSLLDENDNLKKELSDLNEEKCLYSPKLSEQEGKLKSLTDSLIETKKALSIREAQIESAKKQYNELMDVAQRYRDEAIKWRMKFSAGQS